MFPAAQEDASSKPSDSRSNSSTKVATSKHLKWPDLESWRKDNHYIQSGYHVVTNSWRKAWLSLLGEPHSETVNILSHLVGAIVVSSILIYTYKHVTLPRWFGPHPQLVPDPARKHFPLNIKYPFPSETTPVTYGDTLAFASFYLAATACFGFSATFHTSILHSERMMKKYNKIDYLGIVFLITGTYYPALYYAFYCQPIHQLVYMLGVTAFGAATAFIVLSPGYASRRVRTWLFIGLGVSGVVPILQSLSQHGLAYSRDAFGLYWLMIGGAFYIAGALLYAERIPERFAPGKFDIYGNSHQIFHVACLLAALSHYIGICQAFDYRHHYTTGCPAH
ncbi:HlyIII-domain-containing protein [Cystobasidium minutum MCA 4210]|uniref:HlyIII-domain-containing protein n=1 Tax=Cystobasidium minutum MCA 4210 TaxID=1397322 RepID=UPI0034CFF4C8|eukprot:jgi/Rhomi1/47645/CE47644_995